jgi:hypothetical protein
MQLSVVRNLILVEFSYWFAISGLFVIDAVGWRSMYLVVMPRVNLIVILSSYARCLYSINCPTVICLSSMCYFILWRDTTSELWTPVLFLSYCYQLFTLLALFILLAYYYYFPLDTLIPLFTANRWDWQPQSIWLCCVQVPRCSWQSKAWMRRLINYPELSQASKHHLQSFGFFPFGSINLGFLLRENFAAIFIIPSSWGSQLDGEH